MMTVINMNTFVTGLSDEALYDLLQAIKVQIQRRHQQQVSYEPTGRQDLDDAHYTHMQKLEGVLAVLDKLP